MPADATFYYDISSPYAYLAAARIDDVLPGTTWRPIAFGIVITSLGKTPWSLGPGREAGLRELQERAAARGLPPMLWPEGWPAESYSLAPLRAALAAEDRGLLREFTLAAYDVEFVEGRALNSVDAVRDAAVVAGLDPDVAEAASSDEEIKQRLRQYTEDALARGVTGVPTVAVGDELFWGDDQLEAAAAAAAAAASSSASAQ